RMQVIETMVYPARERALVDHQASRNREIVHGFENLRDIENVFRSPVVDHHFEATIENDRPVQVQSMRLRGAVEIDGLRFGRVEVNLVKDLDQIKRIIW